MLLHNCFNSIIKKLAISVIAVGLVAPIASQAFNITNPISTTVNARRRHYHKHYRKHYHRLSKAWRYANWYSSHAKRFYNWYHRNTMFRYGMNDGMAAGNYNDNNGETAYLDMDCVNNSKYYKGWIISHAITRDNEDVDNGYEYANPHQYKDSVSLWNNGLEYGYDTGAEFLKYSDGSWNSLDPNDNDYSFVSGNSNILANLYGSYYNNPNVSTEEANEEME